MKKVFSIILIFIISSLVLTGCLPKEEAKKDLSELKLDLDPVGLPDQVFSQISCLTAAYNFYENTELTNKEFIDKFGFDLSDVESWEYDQYIPWEEIEQKVNLNFKHVNYMSDYNDLVLDEEKSREELIKKNIDEGNIMMLRLESYLGDYSWNKIWDSNVNDYVWTQTVEYRSHTFWLIWVRYKGEFYNFSPSFLSPIFPDAFSFSDLGELSDIQYAATDDMVIISRKDK